MTSAIKLTDDAKAALSIFQQNPCIKLNFNTPSRINPRMRSALDALIEANLITEEPVKKAASTGLSFYANPEQRDMIRQQPRVTYSWLKAHPLPLTVN